MIRLVLALLLVACGSTPIPSASFPSVELRADDERLYPPLRELAAHPEWADAQSSDLTVTRVVPSWPHLCVAVQRESLPGLHLAIDVDGTPWRVATVALDEIGPEGPPVTYERAEDEGVGDWCAWTLRAIDGGPFPAQPADVEVVSIGPPLDPAVADALRLAVHAAPERFGIDRANRPEVWLLEDHERSSDFRCLELRIDFRAIVQAGVQRAGDGWDVVSIRVVRQALATPPPRTREGC